MIVSHKMVIIPISGKKLHPSSMDGVVSNELAKTNFFLYWELNGAKYIPCTWYKFSDMKSL